MSTRTAICQRLALGPSAESDKTEERSQRNASEGNGGCGKRPEGTEAESRPCRKTAIVELRQSHHPRRAEDELRKRANQNSRPSHPQSPALGLLTCSAKGRSHCQQVRDGFTWDRQRRRPAQMTTPIGQKTETGTFAHRSRAVPPARRKTVDIHHSNSDTGLERLRWR